VGCVARMGEMNVYKILSENPKGREHSEYLDVDGKIVLEWILKEIGCEGVDWIRLAQVRDQWWALLKTVVSIRVA